MNQPLRIAIIGGGASGTITATHLLQKLKKEAEIYFIEKHQETVYRGAAYSSSLEYEPLNVPAGKMSIFNDAPADFFEWLKTNKQSESETAITEESFVSRRWFGEYLKEKLETAVKQNLGSELKLLVGAVDDITDDDAKSCYKVFLNNGKSIFADYLIFATGNEAPAELFTGAEISLMGNRYIANPWNGYPFKGLKRGDDVLVLGTGLTTIDHVISLYKKNHSGKIYALSRHGYLPLPHAQLSKYEFDLSAVQNSSLTTVLSEVKKNILKAKSAKINWHSVLDALRTKTSDIWKSLDGESKKAFLKRVKPFWEIHRHRVPPESMRIIELMKEDNLLQIIPGSIKNARVNEGKIEFTYISRKDKKESSIQIDYIINCTGPSENGFLKKNILFKNLLAKGWMRSDEIIPGIKTGLNGEIIQQNMQPLKNAYAIGPLRKPAEWETTAVREIRAQAEKLASNLSQL